MQLNHKITQGMKLASIIATSLAIALVGYNLFTHSYNFPLLTGLGLITLISHLIEGAIAAIIAYRRGFHRSAERVLRP